MTNDYDWSKCRRCGYSVSIPLDELLHGGLEHPCPQCQNRSWKRMLGIEFPNQQGEDDNNGFR